MIALLPWRWQAHILFWLGHSVPYIATWTGRTLNDVEYALEMTTPQRAASELAKHGAAMRRESERAKRLRVMNELRRQLNMPEWKA